jgi:hypothetical protein
MYNQCCGPVSGSRSSSQIHSPDWGDNVDSGIGCRTGPLGCIQYVGRAVRQPYAGVNYVPHSGTMNLATDCLALGAYPALDPNPAK